MVKVYTCLFCGDEMISDSYDIKFIYENAVIEYKSKLVSTKEENFGIAENLDENEESKGDPSSATATKEGGKIDMSEKVIDVVENFELKETSYNKKEFQSYLKTYFPKIIAKLKETNPSRVDGFKKSATEFVKFVLLKFDDFKFYSGKSADPDGSLALSYYKDGDSDATFLFFADALKGSNY